MPTKPRLKKSQGARVAPSVNVSRAIAKIANSIRSRGALKTLLAALTFFQRNSFLRRDDYDQAHGVDTGGNHPLWTLVDDPKVVVDGHPYHPVDEADLENALRKLDLPFSKFDFIDVGCGKGRALLVAAPLGFRTLLGVEFVPALAAIARKNLTQLAIRNASIVECDARHYSFAAHPTVIFLNNPFGRDIMQSVVQRLTEVAAEQYVIYVVPGQNEVFAESGQFEKTAEFRGAKSGDVITIWKRIRFEGTSL
jgi:predicted RNA methylase